MVTTSACSKKANKRFMTWIFPPAPACLKSNLHFFVNEIHSSNISLDRPWILSKKVWHSPREMHPLGALQAAVISWAAGHPISPPLQSDRSFHARVNQSSVSTDTHIYRTSRKLSIARGKKASWWLHNTIDVLPKRWSLERSEYSLQTEPVSRKMLPTKSRSSCWRPASLKNRTQQQLRKFGEM